MNGIMRFLTIIHRILLMSALLGIIFGPVSIGTAGSVMASSVSTHQAMMLEDLGCCPGEKAGCNGAACPLAVLCAATFAGHPADEQAARFSPVWTAYQFSSIPYPVLTSALVEPPARPPSF